MYLNEFITEICRVCLRNGEILCGMHSIYCIWCHYPNESDNNLSETGINI